MLRSDHQSICQTYIMNVPMLLTFGFQDFWQQRALVCPRLYQNFLGENLGCMPSNLASKRIEAVKAVQLSSQNVWTFCCDDV